MDVGRWNEAVQIIEREDSGSLSRRIGREEDRRANAQARFSEANRQHALGKGRVRALKRFAAKYGGAEPIADALPELDREFEAHRREPQRDRPEFLWFPIEQDGDVNLRQEGSGSIRAAVSREHCINVDVIAPLNADWTWSRALDEHERMRAEAAAARSQAEQDLQDIERNITTFSAVLDEYDRRGEVKSKAGNGHFAALLDDDEQEVVRQLAEVCRSQKATSKTKAVHIAAKEAGVTEYHARKTAIKIGAWVEGEKSGVTEGRENRQKELQRLQERVYEVEADLN